MNDDMKLPDGRTCVDCAHYRRCLALIGERHINDRQTRCDWSPSRFIMVSRPAAIAAARHALRGAKR